MRVAARRRLSGEVRTGTDRDTDSETGGVTVEAAVGIASIVVVLGFCLAAVAVVIAQLRCADAAGEAARLAGRGDDAAAVAVAARIAPAGARISIERSGDVVVASVTGDAGSVLSGISVAATAVAADEQQVVADAG